MLDLRYALGRNFSQKRKWWSVAVGIRGINWLKLQGYEIAQALPLPTLIASRGHYCLTLPDLSR